MNARRMRVAGERVENKDRVRAIAIERSVDFVGDVDRAEPRTALERDPRSWDCYRLWRYNGSGSVRSAARRMVAVVGHGVM